MTRITEFRYCRAQHIPIADEIVDDPAEGNTPATETEPEEVVPERKPVCGRHIIDGLEFDFSELAVNFRAKSYNHRREDYPGFLNWNYCAEVKAGKGYVWYTNEVLGMPIFEWTLVNYSVLINANYEPDGFHTEAAK